MKKFWLFLSAAAVLAGIFVVGCNPSDDHDSGDFKSFGASLLDYDYWKPVHDPGVMGPGDEATLVIGKIGYEATELYLGKVTWSLSTEGVLVFTAGTTGATVAEDGLTATGIVVGIKAVGAGTVTVIATDASGIQIWHEFEVGYGQHYRPDGGWDKSSSYSEDYSSTFGEDYSSGYSDYYSSSSDEVYSSGYSDYHYSSSSDEVYSSGYSEYHYSSSSSDNYHYSSGKTHYFSPVTR